jgi:hypothetical protein
LEGWLALRLKLLVYLIDDGLHTVRIGVAAELRLYASRMHGGSAHAALLVPPVAGELLFLPRFLRIPRPATIL